MVSYIKDRMFGFLVRVIKIKKNGHNLEINMTNLDSLMKKMNSLTGQIGKQPLKKCLGDQCLFSNIMDKLKIIPSNLKKMILLTK